MAPPLAWYREFLPCKALAADVYAFFCFVPGSSPAAPHRPLLREVAFCDAVFCATQLADGHASITFELGRTCRAEGGWSDDPTAFGGTVVGPMTRVGRMKGIDLAETVGVYFRPARVTTFLGVAMSELTDRAVPIDYLWGTAGTLLSAELRELNESSRVDRLESVLLTHLANGRDRTASLDVPALASSILRRQGRWTVEDMASAAGVSRQHLTREFRERIGIAPKLYSRLARFQSGLRYAGSPAHVDWACAAADMGYADQSHMIAEFREFSGLTPQVLASRDWFHPFIERTRPVGRRRLMDESDTRDHDTRNATMGSTVMARRAGK